MNYYKFCLVFIVALYVGVATKAQHTTQSEVIITAGGDTITMQPGKVRTVRVNDVEKKIMMSNTVPMFLNGKEIYNHKYDTTTYTDSENRGYYNSIYEGYEKILAKLDSVTAVARKQLPDGHYFIEVKNMVIDGTGHMVYSEAGVLKIQRPTGSTQMEYSSAVLPEVPSEIVKKLIVNTLKDIAYPILLKDWAPTPYLRNFSYYFRQKWDENTDPHALPEWLYK